MIMKKLLSIVLCLSMIFLLAACGGGDALKGTWVCEDEDYGTVTWKFDGSGKCSMSNDFFEGDGTYTITDNQVSIHLSLWDGDVVYDYEVSDSSLKLTATDSLAPDYDLSKK